LILFKELDVTSYYLFTLVFANTQHFDYGASWTFKRHLITPFASQLIATFEKVLLYLIADVEFVRIVDFPDVLSWSMFLPKACACRGLLSTASDAIALTF